MLLDLVQLYKLYHAFVVADLLREHDVRLTRIMK